MSLNDVGVRLVAESEQAFISALDNAAGAVKNLTDQAAGGFGFATATDQADLLTTAISVGLYDAIKSVAGQLIDLGTEAFNTIADFERTTQSIEAMMAIEIGMGETVTDVTEAVYELTDADIENARVFDKAARGKQKSVENIRDSIEKMIAEVEKDPSNEDLPQRARLQADLDDALLETTRIEDKAAAIRSKHGETFQVETKRQINQVNDINEAMRLAKKPADEMLESLTRMALQSPFERKPILDVMKQGQAFGFTAKESLKATEAFVKFATVTGRNEGHITRLGYAMGQMKSQGKVMTRQLRQMNMAGMGMNQMAEAMGMSTEEFTSAVSKGKIPFEEFNENLMAMVDTKYTPAYKQINESFFGLQNAIKDINKLSLAAFFEGTMEAGKGIMIELVRPFTEGDALNAIKGFGDRIGEYLAPGLKVVADKVHLVMQGFMDLSTMINGPVNKEFTNATDEAGHAKKIIEELGVALNNTAGDGMSQSRAFADLTAKAGFAKDAQGNLKDQIIASTGVNKAAQASHAALAAIYTAEETKIVALEKANKTSSREYIELTAAHAKTEKSLDALNTARNVTSTDLQKLTDKEKTNNAELDKSEKALKALGDPLKNLSPEYQLLIDKKKLLEAAGKTENDTYKGIVAEMKRMEDGTVTYVETSRSLSETTELSKDLADKLALATIEQDKLKAAAGPIPESFMGKIIASFDEFIDKNGPVAAILLGLEDIFLKIKKKVTDAWEATKTFIQGIDPKNSGLWIVNDALKGLRDNFDKIWHVGENVVKVVVGLAFLNRIAGFAMAAATALGFFLTPLGLITGAVGLLTWEYDKGNKGVVDFVDKHKASLDGWYANTKKMFDANTGEGKLFRQNVQDMKNGVNRIFESEFSTKLPVDMAIADMRRVNAEGFEDIKTGITNVGIQFGILPSTMDKIADLILVPIATIKGIIQGIYVAFKLGVIDEIVKLWKSNPGSKEAQGAADKITEILKKLLPEGWAENIETAVGKVTTIIQTLRWAFDKLKESLEAIQKAFKPVITFLSENREKILPVLIALAEITAAVWLLNGALVAVTGVSLASLATGLAPAAADAGALANLQMMRGQMGLGVKTEKAGGQSLLAGILDKGDPKLLKEATDQLNDARRHVGLLGEDITTLEKGLAALQKQPFFDVVGFEKEVSIMKAAGTWSDEMAAGLKVHFTRSTAEAAAMEKSIVATLKELGDEVTQTLPKIEGLEKVLVEQELKSAGVWDKIKKKSKDAWTSATDDISTYYNKAKGAQTSFDDAVFEAGGKRGVKSYELMNTAEIAARDNAQKLAKFTEEAQLDETIRRAKALKEEAAGIASLEDLHLKSIDRLGAVNEISTKRVTDLYDAEYAKRLATEMSAFDETAKRAKDALALEAQGWTDQEKLLDWFSGQRHDTQIAKAREAAETIARETLDIELGNLKKIELAKLDSILEFQEMQAANKLEIDVDAMRGKTAKKFGFEPPKFIGDDIASVAKGGGKMDELAAMSKKLLPVADDAAKGVFGTVKATFVGGFDDLFLKAIPKLITGGIGGIWALIKAPFLAIAAGGGFFAFLGTIFTAGSGGFIAAIMYPMNFVIAEFISMLGFISTIFSFIGAAITSPFAWAVVAVLAILWGLYYDIGGITTAIIGFFELILVPIYLLWNGFLVLSDVVTYVMMAIWERMVSVWESAIKPVFTMFNTAIAVLFDWMTWLLYPFIMFYSFIIKFLVPIIAVVFYGTMMAAWYVIEIVIEIVMLIVKVIFAFFQAIYSIAKIIFYFIGLLWDWFTSLEFVQTIYKKLVDSLSSGKTSNTFKGLMELVTMAINGFQVFKDIIMAVVDAFYQLSEAAGYDWFGWLGAKLKGKDAVAEFEKEKGVMPTVTWNYKETPPKTVEEVTAMVEQAWGDLTDDTVRQPRGDESALESLWLMATNAMKSPDAKAQPEKDKKAAGEANAKKTEREAAAQAKYDEKNTAASDAARIAAMNARTASLQAPIAKAPPAGAGKTTKSWMGIEGGIDPRMMTGRTKGANALATYGDGYQDNSRQNQSAVTINNNNSGKPPDVNAQVGAALSAQWSAQSGSQSQRYNQAGPPLQQTMTVAGAAF